MKNKNLTSYDDHIDEQYGKRGTPEREEYEKEFRQFIKDEIINGNLNTETIPYKCCKVCEEYYHEVEMCYILLKEHNPNLEDIWWCKNCGDKFPKEIELELMYNTELCIFNMPRSVNKNKYLGF